MSAVPSNWHNLTSLRELDLAGNDISSLPESFARLQRLRSLDLSYNVLTRVPPALSVLPELRVLNLAANRLVDFPSIVLRLETLEVLNLNHTRIALLPADIFQLAQLRELHLRGNHVADIPSELSLVPLDALDLRETPYASRLADPSDLQRTARQVCPRSSRLQYSQGPVSTAQDAGVPSLRVSPLRTPVRAVTFSQEAMTPPSSKPSRSFPGRLAWSRGRSPGTLSLQSADSQLLADTLREAEETLLPRLSPPSLPLPHVQHAAISSAPQPVAVDTGVSLAASALNSSFSSYARSGLPQSRGEGEYRLRRPEHSPPPPRSRPQIPAMLVAAPLPSSTATVAAAAMTASATVAASVAALKESAALRSSVRSLTTPRTAVAVAAGQAAIKPAESVLRMAQLPPHSAARRREPSPAHTLRDVADWQNRVASLRQPSFAMAAASATAASSLSQDGVSTSIPRLSTPAAARVSMQLHAPGALSAAGAIAAPESTSMYTSPAFVRASSAASASFAASVAAAAAVAVAVSAGATPTAVRGSSAEQSTRAAAKSSAVAHSAQPKVTLVPLPTLDASVLSPFLDPTLRRTSTSSCRPSHRPSGHRPASLCARHRSHRRGISRPPMMCRWSLRRLRGRLWRRVPVCRSRQLGRWWI